MPPVAFATAKTGNRFANTAPTRSIFGIFEICAKRLIVLAPRAGFEPATIRLTVECSTAELPRNRANQVRAGQRITKPPSLAKDEMGHAGATLPGNGKAQCHDVLSSLFRAQKQRSGS